MYSGWTVNRLKIELSARGAHVSGRKEVLIERLEAYDRNNNFRNEVIVLPEATIPNWPTFGFKQLVKDHKYLLPKVDHNQIEGYFRYRIVMDNDMAKDQKAMVKGKGLLESSRILACSIQMTRQDIHLTGIVGAAMKKKVSYSYKIWLNGQNGEVVNTHCECPAGKGPHGTCKHIAAVLLMIASFLKDGEIRVLKSCTESLQTFHTPKRVYDGSPVKAENLPARKKPCLEDPRPFSLRNQPGYNDHVRNVILNYCWSSGKDITMRYLYRKADLQSAAHDHHYLRVPFTHYWIDNMIQITEAESVKLEQMTRKQAGSKLWHEARQCRITASRFGEVIAATERRNKDKFCASIADPPTLSNPAVIHGIKFEAIAKHKFETKTGLKVKNCGLFVRPDFPWLGATPDGVIDDNHIVEIKCPYTARDKEICVCKELPYLQQSGDTIILKQSHKYYHQIQGQLFLSKRKFCYFVVYTQIDMFIQKIEVDLIYCQHSLMPKLESFYSNFFKQHLARNL